MNNNTPSSRGNKSSRVWQGIGLDQFKEKMGYRKPNNNNNNINNNTAPPNEDSIRHVADHQHTHENVNNHETSKKPSAFSMGQALSVLRHTKTFYSGLFYHIFGIFNFYPFRNLPIFR